MLSCLQEDNRAEWWLVSFRVRQGSVDCFSHCVPSQRPDAWNPLMSSRGGFSRCGDLRVAVQARVRRLPIALQQLRHPGWLAGIRDLKFPEDRFQIQNRATIYCIQTLDRQNPTLQLQYSCATESYGIGVIGRPLSQESYPGPFRIVSGMPGGRDLSAGVLLIKNKDHLNMREGLQTLQQFCGQVCSQRDGGYHGAPVIVPQIMPVVRHSGNGFEGDGFQNRVLFHQQ